MFVSLFFSNLAYGQEQMGELLVGSSAIEETTDSIMMRDVGFRKKDTNFDFSRQQYVQCHYQRRNALNKVRDFLPQDEQAPLVSSFPNVIHDSKKVLFSDNQTRAITPVLGVNFRALRLSDVGYFPPDSMGAIGPTQFIVAINGRVKSFSKNSGSADGALDADMDVFFNSVRGGKFTSDPRIRYDRATDRWFIIIITITDSGSNKLLTAVSDSGVITGSTTWRFFSINMGGDVFLDYPTLGIDANALYVGGATFSNTNSSRVIVIRKSSILGSGPIVSTFFNNLINSSGEGMFVPQGVDNVDSTATTGYFIGVDNLRFGSLVMRRVSDPGGTPTLSGNIRFTVPATQYPLRVPHLGNNRGFAGRLDSIDDRLMMAQIRNGKLWTTHNIGVNNKGVGSGTITRTGIRWYQIGSLDSTPVLLQSGTLSKKTSTNNQQVRSFLMPSLMVSGQETMVLGCSVAGWNDRANAAVVRRFDSDNNGILSSLKFMTNTSGSYNPPGDPGSNSNPRRWGDYSYTSVDPCDDMTFWTIQEYCDSKNSWAVRVAQIIAPPPATILSLSPSSVVTGQSDIEIQINGSSQNFSGFFDPGDDFDCRLDVSISGGVTVTDVEYIDPVTIKIHVSTIGATPGSKNVTVTNPDGQSTTLNGGLTVTLV